MESLFENHTGGENIIAQLERMPEPERGRALARIQRQFPDDKIVKRTRQARAARRIVAQEEAAAQSRLPLEADYSLSALLAEPDAEDDARVESMQLVGNRTLMVASFKTGKTTLSTNLVASLADCTPFLGRFKVKPPEGRIGIWNGEMSPRDMKSYVRDTGIQNTDRVSVANLRGSRVALLSDGDAEWAVRWLRDEGITYWIVDPWARMCAWSNVNESDNAEVAPLLQRVDEVAADAGVKELFISHHAGHDKGRVRGATVLPDWADSIWFYSRDAEHRRSLYVEGRGVHLDQGLVLLEDGRTIFKPSTGAEARKAELVEAVVQYVTEAPGSTKSEVMGALSGSNSRKDAAFKSAEQTGRIHTVPEGNRKLVFPGQN